jgi:hypothetical protein
VASHLLSLVRRTQVATALLCGAVEHEELSCRDAVAAALLELLLEQVFHAQSLPSSAIEGQGRVPQQLLDVLSLSPSVFFPNPLIRVHAFVFDSVGSDGGVESIASEVLNYGDANLRWICG